MGLLSAVAAALAWWRRPEEERDWQERRLEIGAWLGVSLWTFFLQTPLSTPVWSWVPELGTVQFPWRFGVFQGLAACVLVGLALAPRRRAGERLRPAIAAPLLLLTALPAVVLSVDVARDRDPIFTERRAQHPNYRTKGATEYLPAGLEGWQQFGRAPYRGLAPPVQTGNGAPVEILEWGSHRREFRVESPTDTQLLVRTFGYPGWRAWLDGEPLAIDSENPRRRITLDVPAGSRSVRLEFGSTPQRRAGALLSLLSVGALLGVAGGLWLRARRRVEPGEPSLG